MQNLDQSLSSFHETCCAFQFNAIPCCASRCSRAFDEFFGLVSVLEDAVVLKRHSITFHWPGDTGDCVYKCKMMFTPQVKPVRGKFLDKIPLFRESQVLC